MATKCCRWTQALFHAKGGRGWSPCQALATSCWRLCQPVRPRCPSAGGLALLQGLARGWEGWWELWVPMEPSHPPRSPPPRSLIVRGTASVKSV